MLSKKSIGCGVKKKQVGLKRMSKDATEGTKVKKDTQYLETEKKR